MTHAIEKRVCKSCAHLLRGESNTFRCGYTAPAPWPVYEYRPNYVIGARHVVEGNHYPEVRGSTEDWTEAMDCPVWSPSNLPR